MERREREGGGGVLRRRRRRRRRRSRDQRYIFTPCFGAFFVKFEQGIVCWKIRQLMNLEIYV